jgi:predicted XRE-type DNA-binding protein
VTRNDDTENTAVVRAAVADYDCDARCWTVTYPDYPAAGFSTRTWSSIPEHARIDLVYLTNRAPHDIDVRTVLGIVTDDGQPTAADLDTLTALRTSIANHAHQTKQIARHAIDLLDTLGLADREIATTLGYSRQRVPQLRALTDTTDNAAEDSNTPISGIDDPQVAALLHQLTEHRHAAEAARNDYHRLARTFTARLKTYGLPNQQIGEVLTISRQRVTELLDSDGSP